MGYDMTWTRLKRRNGLEGSYDRTDKGTIAGDLRRVEKNTLDVLHIPAYAKLSGATEEQVYAVFSAFFDGTWSTAWTWDEYKALWDANLNKDGIFEPPEWSR